jgi:hypothetical protein
MQLNHVDLGDLLLDIFQTRYGAWAASRCRSSDYGREHKIRRFIRSRWLGEQCRDGSPSANYVRHRRSASVQRGTRRVNIWTSSISKLKSLISGRRKEEPENTLQNKLRNRSVLMSWLHLQICDTQHVICLATPVRQRSAINLDKWRWIKTSPSADFQTLCCFMSKTLLLICSYCWFLVSGHFQYAADIGCTVIWTDTKLTNAWKDVWWSKQQHLSKRQSCPDMVAIEHIMSENAHLPGQRCDCQ